MPATKTGSARTVSTDPPPPVPRPARARRAKERDEPGLDGLADLSDLVERRKRNGYLISDAADIYYYLVRVLLD